jgi:hypothetical protein
VELSPEQFLRVLNAYSLFRLLLDPAGLGDARIAFESASSAPPEVVGGRGLQRISFFYRDGYRGELFVDTAAGLALPRSIRSCLLFESEHLRRQMGQVPDWKTVTFDDWREWHGRRVSHRIRFDDGLDPRELELIELEELAEAPPDAFLAPGRGTK